MKIFNLLLGSDSVILSNSRIRVESGGHGEDFSLWIYGDWSL